jgi:hypothetical protein
MNFLVRIASTYTADEQANMGITGIPSYWPIFIIPYVSGEVPNNYSVMTDVELAALKAANQAAYNTWALAQIILPPSCVYSYATSTDLSATTMTTWQSKILLTTEAMIGGEYNVSWSYSWYYTSKQRNFNARVIMDSSVVLHSLVQEPPNASSSQRHSLSGFRPITIEQGIHTIELSYKSSNSSDEAGIEMASIELLKKIR